MRPLSLVLLLVPACSEYELAGSGGAPPPAYESTDSETLHFTGDACPDDAIDGFDANINESCVNEIQTGTFDPVVKWAVPTLRTEAGTTS